MRNASGRLARDQFTLDFAAGQPTCPAGVSTPFEPGKTVRFPAGTLRRGPAAGPLWPAARHARPGTAYP